jgi:hypothetical protein
MTFADWRTAQECYDSGDTISVIVRVRNVLHYPEISDVIVDPVKHLKNGSLRVDNHDLVVRVGEIERID